jgi:thioredoxin
MSINKNERYTEKTRSQMNKNELLDKLKTNPNPVVIDFWAPWCGPCRMIEPFIKKLSAEYEGRVDVWKINADEEPDLLRSLNIYGIPTLAAYHNGQEVARRTGAGSPAALSTLFEAALSGNKPVNLGPTPLDRLIRLVAGTALFFLAYQGQFSGWYLILAGLGAAVAFSAVYDRCPIYRAVSARLKAWLRKGQPDQAGS